MSELAFYQCHMPNKSVLKLVSDVICCANAHILHALCFIKNIGDEAMWRYLWMSSFKISLRALAHVSAWRSMWFTPHSGHWSVICTTMERWLGSDWQLPGLSPSCTAQHVTFAQQMHKNSTSNTWSHGSRQQSHKFWTVKLQNKLEVHICTIITVYDATSQTILCLHV